MRAERLPITRQPAPEQGLGKVSLTKQIVNHEPRPTLSLVKSQAEIPQTPSPAQEPNSTYQVVLEKSDQHVKPKLRLATKDGETIPEPKPSTQTTLGDLLDTFEATPAGETTTHQDRQEAEVASLGDMLDLFETTQPSNHDQQTPSLGLNDMLDMFEEKALDKPLEEGPKPGLDDLLDMFDAEEESITSSSNIEPTVQDIEAMTPRERLEWLQSKIEKHHTPDWAEGTVDLRPEYDLDLVTLRTNEGAHNLSLQKRQSYALDGARLVLLHHQGHDVPAEGENPVVSHNGTKYSQALEGIQALANHDQPPDYITPGEVAYNNRLDTQLKELIESFAQEGPVDKEFTTRMLLGLRKVFDSPETFTTRMDAINEQLKATDPLTLQEAFVGKSKGPEEPPTYNLYDADGNQLAGFSYHDALAVVANALVVKATLGENIPSETDQRLLSAAYTFNKTGVYLSNWRDDALIGGPGLCAPGEEKKTGGGGGGEPPEAQVHDKKNQHGVMQEPTAQFDKIRGTWTVVAAQASCPPCTEAADSMLKDTLNPVSAADFAPQSQANTASALNIRRQPPTNSIPPPDAPRKPSPDGPQTPPSGEAVPQQKVQQPKPEQNMRGNLTLQRGSRADNIGRTEGVRTSRNGSLTFSELLRRGLRGGGGGLSSSTKAWERQPITRRGTERSGSELPRREAKSRDTVDRSARRLKREVSKKLDRGERKVRSSTPRVSMEKWFPLERRKKIAAWAETFKRPRPTEHAIRPKKNGSKETTIGIRLRAALSEAVRRGNLVSTDRPNRTSASIGKGETNRRITVDNRINTPNVGISTGNHASEGAGRSVGSRQEGHALNAGGSAIRKNGTNRQNGITETSSGHQYSGREGSKAVHREAKGSGTIARKSNAREGLATVTNIAEARSARNATIATRTESRAGTARTESKANLIHQSQNAERTAVNSTAATQHSETARVISLAEKRRERTQGSVSGQRHVEQVASQAAAEQTQRSTAGTVKSTDKEQAAAHTTNVTRTQAEKQTSATIATSAEANAVRSQAVASVTANESRTAHGNAVSQEQSTAVHEGTQVSAVTSSETEQAIAGTEITRISTSKTEGHATSTTSISQTEETVDKTAQKTERSQTTASTEETKTTTTQKADVAIVETVASETSSHTEPAIVNNTATARVNDSLTEARTDTTEQAQSSNVAAQEPSQVRNVHTQRDNAPAIEEVQSVDNVVSLDEKRQEKAQEIQHQQQSLQSTTEVLATDTGETISEPILEADQTVNASHTSTKEGAAEVTLEKLASIITIPDAVQHTSYMSNKIDQEQSQSIETKDEDEIVTTQAPVTEHITQQTHMEETHSPATVTSSAPTTATEQHTEHNEAPVSTQIDDDGTHEQMYADIKDHAAVPSVQTKTSTHKVATSGKGAQGVTGTAMHLGLQIGSDKHLPQSPYDVKSFFVKELQSLSSAA